MTFPELDLEPFTERDEQIAREDAVTLAGRCLICGKDAGAHKPGCEVETRVGRALFKARYRDLACYPKDRARLMGWTYYENAGSWFALRDDALFSMPATEPAAEPDWGNVGEVDWYSIDPYEAARCAAIADELVMFGGADA